jgi:hypothetical protein
MTPKGHIIPPEMLASTVQFSKNNRAHQNHTTTTVMRFWSRDPEAPGRSPFPQDPTACPPDHPPEPAVPTPLKPKASGRYLPSRMSGVMNSQCSTSMSSHLTNMRRHWWPPTRVPRVEAALAS